MREQKIDSSWGGPVTECCRIQRKGKCWRLGVAEKVGLNVSPLNTYIWQNQQKFNMIFCGQGPGGKEGPELLGASTPRAPAVHMQAEESSFRPSHSLCLSFLKKSFTFFIRKFVPHMSIISQFKKSFYQEVLFLEPKLTVGFEVC